MPKLRYILPGLLIVAACLVPPILSRVAQDAVPPPPVRVKLLFVGDVMQHMPQVTAAMRDGVHDYSAVFEALLPRFAAADIVVANLETTLTRSGYYTGYPCFRSPVALADALRDVGVDVALLANNHCCDGGGEGVRTTLAELDRCGIRHTGVFADSVGRAKNNPLIVERYGVRFAMLNYTYGTNGMPVPKGVVVNHIDTIAMAADLAAAQKTRPDCIVVCVHWGEEYQRQANVHQKRLAGFLRNHGGDIVVGTHPHVIQPFETDSSHVVLYSLGNFVSNQRQRYTDGGLLAEIEVVRYPDGRMEYALETTPVWVALPGYRVLPPEVADTMQLPAAYARFRSDTDKLLGRDYK